VRLFEIGSKFDVTGGELREIEMLAAVATGTRWPEQWGSAREPWISSMSKQMSKTCCA